VLDPSTRIAEVLFGLIMVLTFTGSLSVAEAGREDVKLMLIGALGCNIAWGVIDAIFYLMNGLGERGSETRAWHAVRGAAEPAEAHRVIAEALPPVVAGTLGTEDYESIRRKLVEQPEPAAPGFRKEDWLGALGVFLLVFFTTFPVAIPFLFLDELGVAMRWSNAIAIVLLFVAGYAFGRVALYRPWLTGVAMVLIGFALVSATIALGG
jgi:hypothetical protein